MTEMSCSRTDSQVRQRYEWQLSADDMHAHEEQSSRQVNR